jgi:uncharacterized protein involved in copper resistance
MTRVTFSSLTTYTFASSPLLRTLPRLTALALLIGCSGDDSAGTDTVTTSSTSTTAGTTTVGTTTADHHRRDHNNGRHHDHQRHDHRGRDRHRLNHRHHHGRPGLSL